MLQNSHVPCLRLFLLLLTISLPLKTAVAQEPPSSGPDALYQELTGDILPFLDQSQRNELFHSTQSHPVARLSKVSCYDPGGLTGFCFGRAMAAHLLGRKMALNPDSIRKLFVIGDLKQPGSPTTEWRFHVTTVVKGEDQRWYAIDPIFGEVLTMSHWIYRTTNLWDRWSADGQQAHYYLVHRHAVLPDIRDFRPPENETGAAIIDLSFEPAGREDQGFLPIIGRGAEVYQLSDEATDGYFLTTNEAESQDRFDFYGLGFNDGFTIDYQNYFVDLLNSFGPGIGQSACQPAAARESLVQMHSSGVEAVDPKSAPVSMNFAEIAKRLSRGGSQ